MATSGVGVRELPEAHTFDFGFHSRAKGESQRFNTLLPQICMGWQLGRRGTLRARRFSGGGVVTVNPAGSRLADFAENRRCAVPQRLGRVWNAWGARRRAAASAQQSNGRFPPRGRPGLRLLDALLGHACRTQSRQNRRSAAGARSRTGALRRTGARLLASRMRGLNGAG